MAFQATIRIIPHEEQRYETTGDWQRLPGIPEFLIKVSGLGDWRYEALIGVHELIEALLCYHQCIPQEQVDAFDMEFERIRKLSHAEKRELSKENSSQGRIAQALLIDNDLEPGDCDFAPYRKQHQRASAIEHKLAHHLNVDWIEYSKAVDALYSGK